MTPEGFEERFEELWEISYQVAFRVLGDRQDAADVAQDTTVRVAEKWRSVRDAPVGFTAHVAAQRAIDVWRRGRRRSEAVPTVSDPMPGVVDRVVLAGILRALPRRQRQVVVLRYLADLSLAETASAMNCSEGTVKQHSSRALQALRRALPEL